MGITSRATTVFLGVMIALVMASGIAIAATKIGGDGDNDFSGTAEDDFLDGQGGNDKLQGLAGSDRIEGGDGNDILFGGNEVHSVLSGNDEIFGEDGNDTVVGGPGADVLIGGLGDDIIHGGRGDDSAIDELKGADGNDRINSADVPAAKDKVICGTGSDQVQADPLDIVASDCEEVEIFEGTVSAGADPQANGGFSRYLTSSAEEPDQDPPDTNPPGGATAQGYYSRDFKCQAPPADRGLELCATVDPRIGEDVGVGLYQTSENRWVYVAAYTSTQERKGYGRINRSLDAYDYLYTSSSGWRVGLYAKTSCWSKCWKWTYMDAYYDVRT